MDDPAPMPREERSTTGRGLRGIAAITSPDAGQAAELARGRRTHNSEGQFACPNMN